MREVFGGIKDGDIALAGAFQKYKNQIREDAEICARVLGERPAGGPAPHGLNVCPAVSPQPKKP
jgi:hypothetical protein